MSKLNIRGLYLITRETEVQTPDVDSSKLHLSVQGFSDQVEQTILGGAKIIQYRDKSSDQIRRHAEATALRNVCQRHAIPFIINDDVKLAISVQADGVHLGRDDLKLQQARKLLGPQTIIGISCYNQLDFAVQAEQNGADYIAFGSFFSSPTKPLATLAQHTLLQQAKNKLKIPIVAIGGITPENGAELLNAGADALAVISGVFSQEKPKLAAARYAQLFERKQNTAANYQTPEHTA